MKRRNYRKKLKNIPAKYILLIMTFVFGITIFLGLTLNISGGPLKTVAGYIFVPMQSGLNSTGDWIWEKSNNFKTLKEVNSENEELEKQVEELTAELNTIKLEQYELESYRSLLELDEKYPTYEKVAASVIAKDSGNWFDTFIIDRGTNHGLEVGMNVISGCGLVGIIVDVGPNYAKVRSIIHDSNNVSAMIATTGDNFIVSGDLKLMNESGEISFTGLRDDNNLVEIGTPVVTSYISDQYQQGILIGYISSVEMDSNKLTKYGTITPVVDFEHLQEVLVITKMKETGEEELEASE